MTYVHLLKRNAKHLHACAYLLIWVGIAELKQNDAQPCPVRHKGFFKDPPPLHKNAQDQSENVFPHDRLQRLIYSFWIRRTSEQETAEHFVCYEVISNCSIVSAFRLQIAGSQNFVERERERERERETDWLTDRQTDRHEGRQRAKTEKGRERERHW